MSTPTPEDNLALAVASMFPYAVVAWGITILASDVTFWAAIGWLLAARMLFAAIEFAGSFALWRMRGRKRLQKALLDILSTNRFPHRYYSHDDYLNYLGRVAEDERVSSQVKSAAREIELMAQFHENLGFIAGGRFNQALESALEQYSPRVRAPTIRKEA